MLARASPFAASGIPTITNSPGASRIAASSISSCSFLADGNTASIHLTNADKREQSVDIERYSATGRLIETVTKAVPAGGHTEVRTDLSSAKPEFGWIRVLSTGKGVSVSAAVETIQGNTLESIPQGAVYRSPPLTKRSPLGSPHRWTYNVANNLGFLFYFVNLSEYPVQVSMCQDDHHPNCASPALPSTVSPRAGISFPIDQSRRYAVIESSPGYSVATTLRVSDGTKKIFDASTCIKFEEGAPCAAQPPSAAPTTTRAITPIERQLRTNIEASKSSPAAEAAHKTNPAELEALVKNGLASKCVIITEPAAAEVYIDGLKAAVTPFVFVLLKKGDAPRTIEIRLTGYRAVEKHVVPDGHLITIQSTLEKQ